MSYDPRNIKSLEGVVFRTQNSEYSIRNGRLYGRPSLKGARVIYVNGLTEETARLLKLKIRAEPYCPELKAEFDELALKSSVIPAKGLEIVIGIVDEDAKQMQRVGLVSSEVDKIYKSG